MKIGFGLTLVRGDRKITLKDGDDNDDDDDDDDDDKAI